jgi:hypothetical protein
VVLTEIDLSKTTKDGSEDLKVGPTYLCLIYGLFHVGKFHKQWYGLNFGGWRMNPAGIQYDPPGTNGHAWEKVWMLEGADEVADPFIAARKAREAQWDAEAKAKRIAEEEEEEEYDYGDDE